MKTQSIRLSTVLIIVLANLLISSPIFAQVKTQVKKEQVNQINKKQISNTSAKEVSVNKELKNRELLIITKEGSDIETETPTPTPTPPYSVGDFIHGGIVFYVDETGEHGLVCAKTNQSGNIHWSGGYLISVGANEEGLYKGMENTIAAVETEQGPTAPRICYELEITEGGITYSDWYLPSKDELNLISQNYAVIDATATANGGDILYQGLYWSSTEYGGSYAWLQFCSDFSQDVYYQQKVELRNVRAVRKF